VQHTQYHRVILLFLRLVSSFFLIVLTLYLNILPPIKAYTLKFKWCPCSCNKDMRNTLLSKAPFFYSLTKSIHLVDFFQGKKPIYISTFSQNQRNALGSRGAIIRLSINTSVYTINRDNLIPIVLNSIKLRTCQEIVDSRIYMQQIKCEFNEAFIICLQVLCEDLFIICVLAPGEEEIISLFYVFTKNMVCNANCWLFLGFLDFFDVFPKVEIWYHF